MVLGGLLRGGSKGCKKVVFIVYGVERVLLIVWGYYVDVRGLG